MNSSAVNSSLPFTPTWTPESAYEQTLVEMAALPDAALRGVNLDVPTLVARVRITAPRLRPLEQRMVATLRDPPVGLVERLERYAWALQQAHSNCLGLVVERPNPVRIARELAEMRRLILSGVRGLVLAGRIDGSLIEPFLFIKGYRSLARSVCGIVVVCRLEWAQIQNASPLTREYLERAFSLAAELVVAVQSQREPPEPLARALRERRQVFTLLVRVYTELRRAAQLLCADRQQADALVPSLYRKKPRGRPSANAVRRPVVSPGFDPNG